MNIRLVGAQTVARPEFRELAPFLFTDFVGGFNVRLRSCSRPRSGTPTCAGSGSPAPTRSSPSAGFQALRRADRAHHRYRAPRLQTYRNASSPTTSAPRSSCARTSSSSASRCATSRSGPTSPTSTRGCDFPAYGGRHVDSADLRASATARGPVALRRQRLPRLRQREERHQRPPALQHLRQADRLRRRQWACPTSTSCRSTPSTSTLLQRLHKGLKLNFNVFNMLNWRQRIDAGRRRDLLRTRRGVTFVVGFNYTF
jgi:hypothetical protein